MKRWVLMWLFALLLLGSAALAEGDISSKAMLNEPGRRIGISQGSAAEEAVASEFPEASIVYYTDNLLGYTAVAQGKLDAYVYDLVQMQLTIDNGFTGVHLLPEVMDETVKIALGYSDVSGIADLKDRLNRFIAEVKADGTLDDMYRRWVMEGNSAMPEIPKPESPQLHLTVGTTSTVPPYSYYEGDGLTGFDIELAHRFAAWLGADLSLEVYDFGGIVPAAKSGKIDVIMSNLQYLPERFGGLSFSDILYEEKMGIMVRGDAPSEGGETAAPAADAAPAYAAYNGKRIAVQTGTISGKVAQAVIGDVQLDYYNSQIDAMTALRAKKADAWATDEPTARYLLIENTDLELIGEKLDNSSLAAVFARTDAGQALCDQYSAFVDSLWADGTMAEIEAIWFGTDGDRRTVLDYENLPDTNGTLRMAVDTSLVPFAFVKEKRVTGYDVDIAARFCQANGYRLQIVPMSFDGVLPSVQSGKVDFAATGITVTEERAESVLFSSATYKSGTALVVRKGDAETPTTGNTITSLAQLNDPSIKLGLPLSSAADEAVREQLPLAQVVHYNDNLLGFMDVAQGRIDAYVYDEVQLKISMENGVTGVRMLDEFMDKKLKICVGISPVSKIPDLEDKVNRFIAELKSDGVMDDMLRRWVWDAERTLPEIELPADPQIHLIVGTSGIVMPYSYYEGDALTGFDIEMAYRFAQWLGADLEFQVYDYGAIVPAAVSGKVDVVMANLQYSDERAEAGMIYSDEIYSGRNAILVKDDAPQAGGAQREGGAYTSLEQLNGARIGVQTGTIYDEIVLAALPDAQISYFNTYSDMAAAMEASKIDGFPGDEPVLRLMAAEDDQLAVMDDYMERFEFGFVIPRTPEGDALTEEANAWLSQMRESGELDALIAKWVDGPESEKIMPDYAAYPAERGTLHFATEGAYAPMNYFRGSELVGFEVELAARFCEANGYGFSPEAMNFDGILPAVQSGKVDFGGACISITEERRESVNFSDPYYICRTAMCVLKDKEAPAVQAGGYASLSELSDGRIGVATGTTFDEIVRKALPNAKVLYINSSADLIASLEAGKIDGFAVDEPAARQFCAANESLAVVDEYLDTFEFGFVLPKTDDGERLLAELDAWLVSMKESGALEQLIEKWANGPEDEKTLPDYAAFPAPKGTLTLATEGDYVPMTYYRGSEIVGAEIDLTAQFCEASGYGLEIKVMNFDGILPAIQAGKADLAAAGISITDERRESVNFSVPYYAGGTVMVVLKAEETMATAPSGEAEDASFWGGIKSSFHKTFIREDRWRLFVDGVLTTLLITALAILFGTLLGFVVFMLCRNGNPVANLVTRFCLWLVQGMPMVVLLMILYYVIFGSIAISGIAVAVLGFTLTFGAAVFGLLKMGVGAVDGGQYEAAYALGYSNRRTFFRIILPQALPHVLPAYKGEIVGLIKATAIVGYIAVQDLTKMGDIVRSRTYEAFFPLIAVTIIYFVLEGLIGFIVSRIGVSFNPKRRRPADILKGVKTDDQN